MNESDAAVGPDSPRFDPPSAERFAAHLKAHDVRAVSPWRARRSLGLLIGSIAASLLMGGLAGVLLPWAALGLVMLDVRRVTRRARRLQAQAQQVQDLAMLRQAPQALRAGWRLLPRLVTLPPLHGRVIAAMAHCLDLLSQHDAAIAGYDHLLDHMPADHPGTFQLRLQRAISALLADRLSDADLALRRLRGQAETFADSPWHAGYLLAQLIQDVRTHHYAEAVALCDQWTAALRPLGVEAGYGHALLALCHHQTDRPELARQSWSAATTLISPAALLHRFPELKPLC